MRSAASAPSADPFVDASALLGRKGLSDPVDRPSTASTNSRLSVPPLVSHAPTAPPGLYPTESFVDRDSCNWLDSPHVRLVLSIVVFGASGDLAKKKTFPALYALYSKGYLPPDVNLQIVGYARSKMSDEELRERIRGFLPKDDKPKAGASPGGGRGGDSGSVAAFLRLITYQAGEYGTDEGYQALTSRLEAFEASDSHVCRCASTGRWRCGRLVYLALPPTTYPEVCGQLRRHCYEYDASKVNTATSWFRIIMEKPFGHDLDTSEELARSIGALFSEEHIYRIDHYLGKELVQNMLVMRFANQLFSAMWNRHHIANVQITFKEPFGTEGRGGYFDQYGIVRDVIQNHLAQVLALLAMESPVSLHPDDIRDEKVKVLRCISPPSPSDCVLGQYSAGQGKPGYLEDPTVPEGSRTPTFAAVRLFIHNDRWAGVPIMIKAGKALNERLAAVRIQLRTPAASIFGDLDQFRNEIVIRFQPGEAIYTKVVVKTPGLDMDKEVSELDLTYPERYKEVDIPDAYERLILDCVRGDQQHFVRRDELRAAWAIFTPLLHAIERGEVPLEPYEYGSRGPAYLDEWTANQGYVKPQYEWKAQGAQKSAL